VEKLSIQIGGVFGFDHNLFGYNRSIQWCNRYNKENLREQGNIEPTKLTVQTRIGLAVFPNHAVETIGPANLFLLCPPFLMDELMKTSTPRTEGIGGGRLSRAAQRAAEQTFP
jgi:hypothetical protein